MNVVCLRGPTISFRATGRQKWQFNAKRSTKVKFLPQATSSLSFLAKFPSYKLFRSNNLHSATSPTLFNTLNRHRKFSTSFDSLRKPKTIYALSTPFGVSGVSVIRVSGPSTRLVLEEMTRGGKLGEKRLPLPTARVSSLRTIIVPNYGSKIGDRKNTELERGEVIDEGVVLFFESGKSFTGEDMVELQLHGSISVIRDTLEALSLVSEDMIEAEAGEFTRRAWANGKLNGDLTRLEAVSDLIHSETRAQRKQAYHQLQGHLGELYSSWSTQLYTCLAHVEALVDFGHDEKIDFQIITDNIVPKVNNIISMMEHHLNDNARGQLLRHGITVALVGPPNAGKSSLLNSLAQGSFSIVSDEAGTTRDVVEAKIDLHGFPLILQDTAGLNSSEKIGKVELEGISRAKTRFNFSSVKLVVIDVNDDNHFNDVGLHKLIRDNPDSTIFVLNKVDSKLDIIRPPSSHAIDPSFINGKPKWIVEDPLFDAIPVVHVSCTNGMGLESLKNEITKTVKTALERGSSLDLPALTRQRHRDNITESLEALYRFRDCPLEHIEILAEELRLAGKAVARITGKVDVEQILDIVFKDFCIGK
jgi:tRNA modification GTPase